MEKFNAISNKYLASSRVIIILILISISNKNNAQFNLVPNNSFETYNICPYYFSNDRPPPWYMPTKTSLIANYYNVCSSWFNMQVPNNVVGSAISYQIPKTGNAYIGINAINGIGSNKREYYAVKLFDSLKNNKSYYIEFYTSLSNGDKYGVNNIGLLLTKNAVYVDTIANPYRVLFANPQIVNYENPIITDTMDWVKVSGVYKAQGGEQYITIGNFKTDAKQVINKFNLQVILVQVTI